MPLGYERLRDALIRKGKSEDEAKSMAAAIWNKHHKDNPVTNKPHKELSAIEDLIEFAGGYAMTNEGVKQERGIGAHINRNAGKYVGGVLLSPILGLPVGALIDRARRKRNKTRTQFEPEVPSSLVKGKVLAPKLPIRREMCAIEENCVLLGIPSSDFDAAEARLLKRLKQLGINSHSSRSLSTQEKLPLSAPLVKNPISPNPNPNATTSGPDSPYLGDILAWLRKKQNPSGPLG
jgi:hypothetical protein